MRRGSGSWAAAFGERGQEFAGLGFEEFGGWERFEFEGFECVVECVVGVESSEGSGFGSEEVDGFDQVLNQVLE